MKRLTIHLKNVEKTAHVKRVKNAPDGVMKKIHNTLSFIVKNDTEVTHHLSTHEGNIKKHYFSNLTI